MSYSLKEHQTTILPDGYFIRRSIEKFIKNEKLTLRQEISEFTKLRWAKILNCDIVAINNCITKLRNQYGVHPRKFKYLKREVSVPIRSDLNYRCLEHQMLRYSPQHEALACHKIELALMNILPKGGKGLLIGTATPLCAAPLTSRYDLVCDDNLAVARMIRLTTDEPGTIVIGNAISSDKAIKKGQDFKSFNSTNRFKVILDVVDKDSYTNYVSDLAIEQLKKEKPAKVVLLNSGIFKNSKISKRNYKALFPSLSLDLNFETPSINLTKRYYNLHILAMVKGLKGSGYSFTVLYIHHGIIDIIEQEKGW